MKLPKNGIKTISIIVGIIVAIIGMAFQFDVRVDSKIEASEQRLVQTMERFQEHQDIRYWNQRLQYLTDEKYRLKRSMRENPDDVDLEESYEYIQNEIIKAKERLEVILNNR